VLVGRVRHLALRLSALPARDPFRGAREEALLAKLYDMGLLDTGAKMSDVLEKLTVSSFARRRLPVVMVRLKMSESVKQVSDGVECQICAQAARNGCTRSGVQLGGRRM
jgi:U3 small nucleolar ribonucleoprotein protein IMP3